MLIISQSPTGALTGRRKPAAPPSLLSKPRPAFAKRTNHRHRLVALSSSETTGPSGRPQMAAAEPPSSSPATGGTDRPVSLTDEGVPLEGVIRIERPGQDDFYKKLQSWGQIGVLASGDILCLLVFSAVGRFSHGFPAFDTETLKTADPFIAGWLLGAYFLGAYGDDGKGKNGTTSAIFATAKSWVIGIPVGIGIRALNLGHFPATPFIIVTMGSTGILLVLWRFIAAKILAGGKKNQNDDFKSGNPFELFELLTSLVRRW
ncbi:hypothetical protein LUZ60_006197 [Juncus effusus]|nr:hypothetical protein LUZ60_006197 [Juncus effusus]